jgi:hypothetical protein
LLLDAKNSIMRGLARIFSAGGTLLVPAETPYDRELLFESVEDSTRRYGTVRLELNRRDWRISLVNDSALRCAACGRAADRVIYTAEDLRVCAGCARRLATTTSAQPAIATRKAPKRKDGQPCDTAVPQTGPGSARAPRRHHE